MSNYFSAVVNAFGSASSTSVDEREGGTVKYVASGAQVVAWLYIIFIATSVVGDILYWLISPFFAAYAKFFLYPALVVIFCDLLINGRVIKSTFILAVTTLFGVGIINGIVSNNIGKEFIAHFSPFILATLVYSYGYRVELSQRSFTSIVDAHSIRAGYVLCAFVLLYYLLFIYGYVEYFGAGALFAYPVFYALSKRMYIHAANFYFFNILTGKRSVLAALTLVILLYIYFRLTTAWRLIFVILIGVGLVFLILVGNSAGGVVFGDSFDRFFTIFRYLEESGDILFAIDLATSGRLFDAIAVVEVLGGSIFRWIFGMGFGATFDVYYSFANEVFTTHYSHFAPLSFVFLGGILLALTIFGKLLYEASYAIRNLESHLSLMIIYFTIMSISGANLFTDVFWWVIIGAFTARRNKNM